MIMERLYRSSFALGRYERATAWCDRAHQKYPNDWRFVECGLTLMGYGDGRSIPPAAAWSTFNVLAQLNPPAKAVAAARPYSQIYRQLTVARMLARSGYGDSVRAMLARAREEVRDDPDMQASLLYDEACIRLELHEPDSAVALLEAYIAAKPHLRNYIAHDVQFRQWRGTARFDAISKGR